MRVQYLNRNQVDCVYGNNNMTKNWNKLIARGRYRCCPSLLQVQAMIHIMGADKCLDIREIFAQGPYSSVICTWSIQSNCCSTSSLSSNFMEDLITGKQTGLPNELQWRDYSFVLALPHDCRHHQNTQEGQVGVQMQLGHWNYRRWNSL